MSLPEAWVERIFEKLALVYGHQFLSRWDGMDLARVRADWGHELRGFAQNPNAIAYGLEHLPEKPPTVVEFRRICNSPQAPEREQPIALPRYVETPEELAVRRHIERIQRLKREHPKYGMVTWAFALEIKDQEEPELVRPMVRSMYREAVANWRRLHPVGAVGEVQS